jgi:hypothetical protein
MIDATSPSKIKTSSPPVDNSNRTQKPAEKTRTARRRSRWTDKRNEALKTQRILMHLDEVDKYNRRSGRNQRCILRLRIKRCSRYAFQRPHCKIILFGEAGYFSNNKTKEGGPSEGYRFFFDGESSVEDSDNHYPDDDEND